MNIKKWVGRILNVLVIIVVILISTLGISSKMNNGQPKLFGNQIMSVLSGSMSPTFNTGSIVLVKAVNFPDIQKGDIITFKDLDGRIVTHRILEIQDNKLITKGDANYGKDSTPVTSDRVIGRVKHWVPYLGYVINFTKSKLGLALFFIVPGAYLIISQCIKLFKLLTEEETQTSEGKAEA